ncbi:hypothetical protein [Nocardia lijiangensis]|uniref:hypothetical protein n=1 Tax=Nocardia lijiangensis TaxID=299618 RepID=UPI003D743B9B
MRAWPVTITALVGAFAAAMLVYPLTVYYLLGPEPMLIVLGTGALLAGVQLGAGFGAAVACAVAADRRNGGYRCRSEKI